MGLTWLELIAIILFVIGGICWEEGSQYGRSDQVLACRTAAGILVLVGVILIAI